MINGIVVGLDQQGNISMINENGCRMLGVNSDDVVGKNWFDMFVPEGVRHQVRGVFEQLMRGETEAVDRYINPVLCRDRSEKIIAWNNTYLRDAEGKIISTLSVGLDITEYEKARQALIKSEARLKSIFSAAPVGIGVVINRIFMEVNDRLCSMTGYAAQELIGKSARLLYPSEEEFLYVGEAKYAQINRSGVGTVETRFRCKDGKIINILLSSAPFDSRDLSKGVTFTALDITEKKQTERERDRLFNLSLDLFCIAGFEGYFKQLNPSWKRVLGWSVEELCAKPWLEFVNSDDRLSTEKAGRDLSRGNTVISFENRYLCKDGSWRWLSWDAYPVPEEKLIYAVARDITDKKLHEAAYLAELDFRKAIIENSAEGICVCHSTDLHPYVRFTVWNEKMTEITGYSLDEINELGWYQTMYSDPEIQKQSMERMGRMLLGDNLVGEEWTVTCKSGQDKVLAISTAVLASGEKHTQVLAVMQDMTERIKALEEIRKEKELVTRIADVSPVGIVQVDSRGIIQFVNSRIEQITGRPKETFLGKFYLDSIISAADNQGNHIESQDFMKLDELREPLYGIERVFNLPAGKTVNVVINISPMFNPADRYEGCIVSCEDITARRRMELELLKAEKLESIGVLAGGIAHDFRNLLEGLFGSIEMARIAAEGNDKVLAGLDRALSVFGRAKDLTQQLLTFAKGGSPQKKITDLESLVGEAARFALSGSAINLNFKRGQGLSAALVDPYQISQVINNLVLNARQATEKGGAIDVSLVNRSLTVHDQLPLPAGRYIEIRIKDSGAGIAKEHHSKIFDPFFSTKQAGSGLGLAISFSIIKRHDGHITVESEPDQGAEFHVYLPASDEKPVDEKKERAKDVIRGSGKILVMDDEESIRHVMVDMIEILGYSASTAVDGKDALDKCEKAHKENTPFAAVILDLTVPGGWGGKEIIGRLKEIDPKVRTIVASGYSEDLVLSFPERYGFDASISKPFRLHELALVLNTLLGKIQSPDG